MKRTYLLIFVFYSIIVSPQSKSDLGFLVGSSYYMGDINPSVPFYSPGFNLGVTYRYNLNTRYVLKGEVNYVTLSANDADFSDSYQIARNSHFSSKLYDFSAQFEFNFLPLKFIDRKIFFSPFVSTGLGMAQILSSQYIKSLNIVFPAALGLRTTLGRRWSAGIQWNMRKTLTDKLDGVQNMISPSMRSSFNNNDWYFFYELFVTYKVFDFPGQCPAYQKDY